MGVTTTTKTMVFQKNFIVCARFFFQIKNLCYKLMNLFSFLLTNCNRVLKEVFWKIAFSIFDWVKPWNGLKNQLSNFTISFAYIYYDLHWKKSRLPKMYGCVCVCACVCACVCVYLYMISQEPYWFWRWSAENCRF